MKLGKLPAPARRNPKALKFADFFNTKAMPDVPAMFGHYGLGKGLNWGALGNHDWGDCVWAGAAHEHMVWTHHAAKGKPVDFSEENVLADYSACTGFNYTRITDFGTDMERAVAYRHRTGIRDAAGNRHKIDGHLWLQPGNVEQLAAATYWLGAAGVGIRLPHTCWDELKHAMPWDFTGPTFFEGGHYIPCVGRNSNGNLLCVTWGMLHAMTDAFVENCMDEGCAYVSFDALDERGYSAEGFDKQGMMKALQSLNW